MFLNGNIQVVALFIAVILCLFQEFEGKLEIFERLTVSLSTQLQAHQLVSRMVFVTVKCDQFVKSFSFAYVSHRGWKFYRIECIPVPPIIPKNVMCICWFFTCELTTV